jgi:hypothetical protein
MNKELLVKEAIIVADVENEISLEMAGKMVKNHQDQQSNTASHIFNMSKEAISMILSQPGCCGITFTEAQTQGGEKSLVCGGLDASGKVIIEVTAVDQMGNLTEKQGKFAVIKSLGADPLPVKISFWSL